MEFPLFIWKTAWIQKLPFYADDLPDVLCIDELQLTPKHQPSIPRYHMIRKDRQKKVGLFFWFLKTFLDFSKSSILEVLGIAVRSFSIFNVYNLPPSFMLICYSSLPKCFSVVILTLTTRCGEARTQIVVTGRNRFLKGDGGHTISLSPQYVVIKIM